MNDGQVIEMGLWGFLRTLLWIMAIWYIGKFIFKWWFRRKVAEKAAQQQNSVSEQEAHFQQQERGRVRVNPFSNKKQSNSDVDSGEYVDYEEVE